MNKSLRSLVLAAGIASATALGCNFALADDSTTTPAVPATQGAQQHHCHKGKHHRGHRLFARLAKKLALSDQQKTQMKTNFQANRALVKPIFVSLVTEKHNLRSLIQSGSADEAAIRAEAAKVSAIEADLAVQRAKGAAQFLALLTPDQQAKLKAMQAQREQKFQTFLSHLAAPQS